VFDLVALVLGLSHQLLGFIWEYENYHSLMMV